MIAVVPRRLACKDDYLVIVDMPLEVPCFTIAWPGIAIRRINGSGRCALRSVDYPDASAGFGLFQRKRNLFFSIACLFHGEIREIAI